MRYDVYYTTQFVNMISLDMVQSCGIFVALWPTCVVLSGYVSSPVAQF